MRIMKDIFVGAEFTTKSYGNIKIVECVSSVNIKVEFETGYTTRTKSDAIRNGSVKDKLKPMVFGVGFSGVNSTCKVDGVNTKKYNVWHSMMQRCYDEKYHKKQPTYKDCTVCDEWHDFSVFSLWFDGNYKDGFDLDKDTIIDGNRIYSPKTCRFISKQENNEKASAKTYILESPQGHAVHVYNLTKFCRDNDLAQGNMANVVGGYRAQCKGWRLWHD